MALSFTDGARCSDARRALHHSHEKYEEGLILRAQLAESEQNLETAQQTQQETFARLVQSAVRLRQMGGEPLHGWARELSLKHQPLKTLLSDLPKEGQVYLTGWAALQSCAVTSSSGLSDPRVDKLLTPKQLSELLQVDQSTVYKWSHMGFVPHIKLGKAVRFVESEVEIWLRQRSRQGRKTMRYNVEDSQ